MADEKPLHVRVAEALGWTDFAFLDYGHVWLGRRPGGDYEDGTREKVYRYDTDWAATGPLIERLGLDLFEDILGWHAELGCDSRTAPKLLAAVCNLIVALHEAGRLPR